MEAEIRARTDTSFLRKRWANGEPDWPSYPVMEVDPWRSVFQVEMEPAIRFRIESPNLFGRKEAILIGTMGEASIQVNHRFDRRHFAYWREVDLELLDSQNGVLAAAAWRRGMRHDTMSLSCDGQEFSLVSIATRVFVLLEDVPLMFVRRAWRDSESEKRWRYVLHANCDGPPLKRASIALLCIERANWLYWNAGDLTQYRRE